MKQTALASVFAVALSAGAGTANAQYILDHFNCYQIQPGPTADAVVGLSDQFASYQALVQARFRFCNTTAKAVPGPTGQPIVTPIRHKDDHLTMYQISPQPPVNLTVLVSNQFGEQTLVVTDARYLAVPTQKSPHQQPPVDLDHYLCYAASGNQLAKPAFLADQFHQERIKVNSPALLCNPVKKEHNGTITEVRHPDDHLVCYTKTVRQFVTTRGIRNQFQQTQITTIASDFLCVPSKKKILGSADEPVD